MGLKWYLNLLKNDIKSIGKNSIQKNHFIIVKECRQKGFLRLFLTIYLHEPSLLVSPLDGIQYPHRMPSANISVSMCNSPLENITYDFVFTPPAVPHMSWLSYWDGLRDER